MKLQEPTEWIGAVWPGNDPAGTVKALRKGCLRKIRWMPSASGTMKRAPAGALATAVKPGPPPPPPHSAAAPHRRRTAARHQRRPVTSTIEQDRLEVTVPIVAQTIEQVVGQNDETGTLGAKGHGSALQILDAMVGTVGAHDEHPRGCIHGK